jgi:Tfp pilus assembly ATPase PilU
MAANNIVARAPLVAVVGATGTGKSEVSLDNLWCILEEKSHQK